MNKFKLTRLILVVMCALLISGCVAQVVGTMVDTTIEVAKIPFKVGGAVIDLATPNKKKGSKGSEDDEAVKKAEESLEQAQESLREAEDALRRAEDSLQRAKGSSGGSSQPAEGFPAPAEGFSPAEGGQQIYERPVQEVRPEVET